MPIVKGFDTDPRLQWCPLRRRSHPVGILAIKSSRHLLISCPPENCELTHSSADSSQRITGPPLHACQLASSTPTHLSASQRSAEASDAHSRVLITTQTRLHIQHRWKTTDATKPGQRSPRSRIENQSRQKA